MIDEKIQWDLYARTTDGAIHKVRTFECGKSGVVGGFVELDEPMDIDGFFAKPTANNLSKWSDNIRIQKVHALAD